MGEFFGSSVIIVVAFCDHTLPFCQISCSVSDIPLCQPSCPVGDFA